MSTVALTNPVDVPLSSVVLLSAQHATVLQAPVEQELQRYPANVAGVLPRLHLVEAATFESRPVGARYFAEQHVAVLTPRLDLRGNVHRVVAAALLERNAEARERFATSVEQAGNDAVLYGERLGVRAQLAALVGAVMSARTTLAEAGRHHSELDRSVRAAFQFLDEVGVSESHVRGLPPTPPYAYLSTITGQHPNHVVQPGSVQLRIGAPTAEEAPGYVYDLVPEAEVPMARREIARAVWPLPEHVLGEAVSTLFVVADVRQSNGCDIGGFAMARDGERSKVVVEHRRGRRTVYHELGHALHFRHNDEFPTADWLSTVPADGYFGSGQKYIEAGVTLRDYSPDLLDRGFITGYASASMEEDIAESFEALMSGDPRLWGAVPGSPRIAAKVRLLIDFLHRIDPTFTEDYFQRMCTERPVQEAAWGHR